jgi:hypothetical protein
VKQKQTQASDHSPQGEHDKQKHHGCIVNHVVSKVPPQCVMTLSIILATWSLRKEMGLGQRGLRFRCGRLDLVDDQVDLREVDLWEVDLWEPDLWELDLWELDL